jgi:plasmid stabilization system protein ParE
VRVRFTGSAENDLERIGDRIAETDSERARLTIRGLRAAARAIGGYPRGSPPVLTSFGVRKKPVRPYLLLYTIVSDEIVILRIAQERSDWTSLV